MRRPALSGPGGPLREHNEQALVDALCRRERAAEQQLVARLREDLRDGSGQRGLLLLQYAFRSRVVGWLQSRWFNGDLQRAEEAWNDTLFRVWTRIERYDESRSRFVNWVWNQARYAALDLLRQPAVGREIPFAGQTSGGEADLEERPDFLLEALEKDAERTSEEPEPLSSAEQRAVRRAFRRLTKTERLLLYLRYVYGLRHVDIARRELAGRPLPEEQVRVYVNRAAKRLRGLYDEELGEARLGTGGESR